jgi:hypothetical protein
MVNHEETIKKNAKLAVAIARDAVGDYPRAFDRFIAAIFNALQKASNG